MMWIALKVQATQWQGGGNDEGAGAAGIAASRREAMRFIGHEFHRILQHGQTQSIFEMAAKKQSCISSCCVSK